MRYSRQVHTNSPEGAILFCQFCKEVGFDRIGLKLHLVQWCEEYRKVDDEMREEQQRWHSKLPTSKN